MTDEIKQDGPAETSIVGRIRSLPNRLVVLIALGVILTLLGLTGVLSANRDVEIERDEAIEIARQHIDFEPERSEARIFRQGPRLDPVWGVSFSIASDGGPREFERLTTVELDARTGEVIRISIDG